MAVVNLTGLVGRDVYTRSAKLVGKIEDTMLDTEKGNMHGFAVTMSRESFLYKMLSPSEQGVKKTILIPFREVIAADDIVLVTVPKQFESGIAEAEVEEEEIPGIVPVSHAPSESANRAF